ncbi:MAG: DUF4062 domain-containing protein [bacterium]
MIEKKKIFLSSTYEDLVEHREKVIETMKKSGHSVVCMEEFPDSFPNTPTKVCEDEIKKCDIFVGIYAHRYGHIPKRYKKSITEQEYEFACMEKKPIFSFIVNDSHHWRVDMVEFEKKISVKLDRLKGKIKERHVTGFFTTPNDLANKVLLSLNRYLRDHAPDQNLYKTNTDGTTVKKNPLEIELDFKSDLTGKLKTIILIFFVFCILGMFCSVIFEERIPDNIFNWAAAIFGTGSLISIFTSILTFGCQMSCHYAKQFLPQNYEKAKKIYDKSYCKFIHKSIPGLPSI